MQKKNKILKKHKLGRLHLLIEITLRASDGVDGQSEFWRSGIFNILTLDN